MKKNLYDFCMENKRTELLRQWDAKMNGDLTPEKVSYGSGIKAWWRCEKGHKWKAMINSRSHGSGCPYCAGKKTEDGCNDLKTEFPELARQWHPTKNIPLLPSQVTKGSCRIVWWRCERGHEWKAAVKLRTEGNGCPYCAGRRILPGENDPATVYPKLAKEWHPVKNESLKPDMVLASTGRRVWWRCQYGHEWQARVKDRGKGNGCPVCSGRKIVAGVNDMESRYPAVAAQWHPALNGKLTPKEVTAFSNRRIWWRCRLGHEWQATVYSRTQEQTGCPYCANRKVLAGFNDLATVEPRIAAQWHPTLNGFLRPEQVTPGSGKKIWWVCPEGHEWKAVIFSRTGGARSGCPYCAENYAGKKRKRDRFYDWSKT